MREVLDSMALITKFNITLVTAMLQFHSTWQYIMARDLQIVVIVNSDYVRYFCVNAWAVLLFLSKSCSTSLSFFFFVGGGWRGVNESFLLRPQNLLVRYWWNMKYEIFLKVFNRLKLFFFASSLILSLVSPFEEFEKNWKILGWRSI